MARPIDKSPRQGRNAQPRASGAEDLASHILPPRAERRPEMIRKRRDERQQVYERERRQWLLTRIGLGAVVVLIAAGLGYAVFASVRNSQVPTGTREFEVEAGHTAETVAYDPAPPVGGQHDSSPQTCGFYSSPIRNETAVHSLEHGAVWITYRSDLAEEQVERLQALEQEEGKLIVSPLADLPAPVVASSWGRQLLLDSADDGRLGQFVRRFRGAAPEPGAPCIGAGTPM